MDVNGSSCRTFHNRSATILAVLLHLSSFFTSSASATWCFHPFCAWPCSMQHPARIWDESRIETKGCHTWFHFDRVYMRIYSIWTWTKKGQQELDLGPTVSQENHKLLVFLAPPAFRIEKICQAEGSEKFTLHHYERYYALWFKELRCKPILRLVEIGASQQSLKTWDKIFQSPSKTILGVAGVGEPKDGLMIGDLSSENTMDLWNAHNI